MGLLIHKAGILDTVQDLGRYGYQRLGINPNGAMDRMALVLINILLKNPENTAGLELHFPAPEIGFTENTLFAIGGADFNVRLGGRKIENWKVYYAAKGETLIFGRERFGARCYLSVAGGFATDEWLGSKSTNIAAGTGGFEGRKLKKGDLIPCNLSRENGGAQTGTCLSREFGLRYTNGSGIRITKGCDYANLTALSEQQFRHGKFRISGDSNRMGFRLSGPSLHLLNNKEKISSAVGFGTIQLLPDGQLVVLMADHQTTGGYPIIGHVITSDLPIAAQLGAGDELEFSLISIEDAEDASAAFERDLSFLRMGVIFTSNG